MVLKTVNATKPAWKVVSRGTASRPTPAAKPTFSGNSGTGGKH